MAEQVYYAYISTKYTQHEFLLLTRWIERHDTEAHEYLTWLCMRFKWPFVHGDVLRPGQTKWKRPRLTCTRRNLAKLLNLETKKKKE